MAAYRMEGRQDFDGFSRGAQAPATEPSSRWGVWLPSVAVLLLFLLPTVWMTRQQLRESRIEDSEMLGRRAERIQSVLTSQLRNCGLLIRSVQSLYLASGDVTEAEFQAVYANMKPREDMPSLQVMAFAELRDAPGGRRYVTTVLAPLEGNEALLGLDTSTQAHNQRAVELARDTDEVVMSAPFRLVQFDRRGAAAEGVALRLPVYSPGPPPRSVEERRRRAVGSLGFSFHAKGLIEWALPGNALNGLHVRIDDVGGAEPILLYDSRPGREIETPGNGVHRVDVVYGGRTWRVQLADIGGGDAVSLWRNTALVPGLLISLLAALLVGSQATTRHRALNLGWQLSRRYRESEQRFRVLNELLPALVVLADAGGGRVRYANQVARECFGARIDGCNLADLFEDDDIQARLQIAEPKALHGVEAVLRVDDVHRFWANVSIQPLELEGERKLLMVASDISEQRKLTELLAHQASHDSLTELFNRREFERRLDLLLDEGGDGETLGALFYIDLDQFKLINDTSGHIAGDQLLVQLAMRMREMLGDEAVIARLGGDEFGVLTTAARDRAAAERLSERILRLIDGHVFVWEKRSHATTASIGVVMIQQPVNRDDLMAQADTACYIAKEDGRNRVHVYSALDDDAARRESEMEWANRLRWAIDRRQLVLMYQEVLPLAAPAETAARIEILLRFRGDYGRQTMPGTFIPAAERYGLMPMIDRWVIETVIANFDQLHPQGAGLAMAMINLSGASLEDESLADHVLALLERHRLDPARLCFEITETVAVRNLARAARLIERLRAVGCSFALDDFGAGMSSFGYLKNLPVDYIKIDGSFSRDMLDDPMSEAVVRAVGDIGHRLGLKVIAEWVDDPRIANALVRLGVDFGQGFSLHRPESVTFQRTQVGDPTP